jgi:hypothetical protein
MNGLDSTVITVVVALITAVVGPSSVEWVKSRLKKSEKEEDDEIIKEMKVDNNVNEQIEVLLNVLNCDRIWILQFHNGGHYYSSGVSIKKFSIFYEVVAPGIAKIQQQFQNIPSSFFSKSFAAVNEKDQIEIYDFSNERVQHYGLKDAASQIGCRSLLIQSLKTPTKKFHGVIGVEFVKEKHNFTAEDINHIKAASAYISGLISAIHYGK